VKDPGNIVCFSRPDLIEEYSVSADGLRQDFVIPRKPSGRGELCVSLTVSGAHAEQTAYDFARDNHG
jgi:hypothetical protein